MAYRAFYTRAYTLPVDPLANNDGKSEGLSEIEEVFDSRYRLRNKVRFINLKPSFCRLDDIPLQIKMGALCHKLGGATILVELFCEHDVPTEHQSAVQENWHTSSPIFKLEGNVKTSILGILNAAVLRLLGCLDHAFHSYLDSRFAEIVDEIASWSPFQDVLFEKAGNADIRFRIPTIFGCTTIVETTADSISENDVAGRADIRLLSKAADTERLSADPWFAIDQSTLIRIDRNSALLLTTNDYHRINQYAVTIAFMNLVRHFGNFMTGETSSLMDSMGQINGSFLSRKQKGTRLRDRFKRSNVYRELVVLKSGFVSAFDEAGNISLWHSSELVTLASSIRKSKAWNLENEIGYAAEKLEELTNLTDLLHKEDLRKARRFITPVLAVIGVINFLGIVPVIKSDIMPAIEFWGPILTLALLAIVFFLIRFDLNH